MEAMVNSTLFRTIGSKDRLVDRVVNEIQRLILAGDLTPGSRLPPERDCAEQLGVSRTVLREAVRALAYKGYLETKQGIGTIVRHPSRELITEPLGVLLQSKGFTIDHLHHVRSILEVEIAGLAALQATEQDIQVLHQTVSAMVTANSPEEFANLDAEFHKTLAQTSHNPLLVVLLDSIRDVMQEVRLRVTNHPYLRQTVIPDHARILDRVTVRDLEGARQAMVAHLEHARRIQEELLQSGEQNTPVKVDNR